jgi:putative tricarboxylic transport membrane protein
VEIVAPANPGGLHDITARSLQRVFQTRKLVEVPVVGVNKGGGGGTVGWTYVAQQRGDANTISLIAVNLLSNHIMGVSTLNYTDFTPLALLFNEYLALAVKADSPIKSGKDAIDQLAKNPQALSIAVGTSLGNTSHLALSLAVKSAGGDVRKLRTVVFGSNGEAMTALLGGHVDAIMTSLPNLVRHIQAGTVRAVAISSPQRVGGTFAQVPTWREQGINVLMSGWRGVVAPPGISPAQTAYWEGVFGALAKTDEWKAELEKNFWHGSQFSAKETREYLDRQYAEFNQILTELGMAKSAKPAK